MTLQIYQWQACSAWFCSSAGDRVEGPGVEAMLWSLADLGAARIASLVACANALADPILRSCPRVVKIILLPLRDGFSFNVFVRMAAATALAVALVFLRVVTSLAGIISPELTFGILKMHRFMVFLGLTYRSQFVHIDTHRSGANPIQSCINDQCGRANIVGSVLHTLRGPLERNEMLPRCHEVWQRAVRHAQEQEDDDDFSVSSEESGSSIEEEDDDFAVPSEEDDEIVWREPEPPAALEPHEAAALEGEFGRPVIVPHPLLEVFQGKFSEAIHSEALAMCRQNLYTKEEMEDMVTAFTPAMYRATCKAIEESFQVMEAELSLASRDITITELVQENGRRMVLKDAFLEDGETVTVQEERLADGQIVRSLPSSVPEGRACAVEQTTLSEDEGIGIHHVLMADGRLIQGEEAGGLEEWKLQLVEIVLLINGMTERMRDRLLYYLCADEERIHRVRPGLPNRSANPVIDRCFKLIVEFYTTFVAHHMPEDSSALQRAFTLSDID